jgi:signal transduction histidine kinase
VLIWNLPGENMTHIFVLLPETILDWLFLIAGLGLVVSLYLRKDGKEKAIFLTKRSSFRRIFFIGIVPLLGVVIEFLFFINHTFTSTAYDASILIRLAPVGFLILYAIGNFSYRRGYHWVLFWGIVYAIFITHSPFTIVEFVLIYVISHKIIQKCPTRDIHSFAVQAINLVLSLTPLFTLISFLQTPGNFFVRLDIALSLGWWRIIAYILSLALAGFTLCFIATKADRSKTSSQANSQDQSDEIFISEHLSTNLIVNIVSVLFLALSSGLWLFQRYSFIANLDIATDEIFTSFAEDYYYFLDIGKALTRSHLEEYQGVSDQDAQSILVEQINRIPFFSSMTLFDEGKLVASYPQDDGLVESVGNMCPAGTTNDTFLSFSQSETYTNYLFSAGTSEGYCLIGISTLEFAPQLNRYIALLNEFSTFWQLTDEAGGYFVSGVVDHEKIDAVTYRGFYKETVFSEGPLRISFSAGYGIETMAKVIAERSQFIGVALFLWHLSLLTVLIAFNRTLFNKINTVFQNMSYLANYNFDALLQKQNERNWFGLNHHLRDIAHSIQTQTAYLDKGLKVVDKLNDVSTYRELQMVIHQEKFLQEIGKMTMLIDPELKLAGFKPADGQYSTQYNTFAKKAQEESFQPFQLQKQLNSNIAGETQTTLFPLVHDGRLLGFLVVLLQESEWMKPHQVHFLQSLSKMMGATIFHRLQRTQDSIENERINFLVRSFPDPIIVLDSQQNLVVINEAAKKLPGIIGEQAEFGSHLREYVRDKVLINAISEADTTGKMETRVQLSNRHEYLVHIISSDDAVSSSEDWVLVSLQDITQYKENDQVRAELFETVAQYLQMPIKMTRGNLRMLSMVGPLNESQRNYSENMEANIDDIDTFVRQMMDRNRLENPANYDMKIVDLDALLKEVVDRIVPFTQQQNVSIYLERKNDFPSRQIQIDPQLFSQAIFNLLENAVQNNHVGGEVEISIENQPDAFIVCIADNGPGISAVDLNRIFIDPSVLELRGDSPRISMGVQLAKSIIERHDGEIWVKSKLGKGSQFFIKIPRYYPSKTRTDSY